MKDFISIADCTKEELREFLDVALRLKKQYKATGRNDALLAGKMLAMIFEKPSLRTRVSFAVAMQHLGGAAIMLRQEEVGLGQREAVKDVARVLSGMCDGVTIRTFDHKKVQELAHWSTIPVINALSDLSHPCQAMAELMTIEEHFGHLEGTTLAFIGDGNNVARALATACGRFSMRFILASPSAYRLSEEDFHGYEINAKLLAEAPKTAVVLHCLPAYRGLEISDEVIEGKQSLVFPQAENRLHFQKGLLAVLMGSARA